MIRAFEHLRIADNLLTRSFTQFHPFDYERFRFHHPPLSGIVATRLSLPGCRINSPGAAAWLFVEYALWKRRFGHFPFSPSSIDLTTVLLRSLSSSAMPESTCHLHFSSCTHIAPLPLYMRHNFLASPNGLTLTMLELDRACCISALRPFARLPFLSIYPSDPFLSFTILPFFLFFFFFLLAFPFHVHSLRGLSWDLCI